MELIANMAGSVWKVNAKVGDIVEAGETVVILESMKMEIPLEVESAGEIAEILVAEGDFINEGDRVLVIK